VRETTRADLAGQPANYSCLRKPYRGKGTTADRRDFPQRDHRKHVLIRRSWCEFSGLFDAMEGTMDPDTIEIVIDEETIEILLEDRVATGG